MHGFFSVIPGKLIDKEKEFQLNRLERLYPFIDRLFNRELSDDVKKKLESSVVNLFSSDLSIQEKFQYKEQFANILKLIKTAYKGNKKFTDHFLMLNDICEAKTENELNEAIQHTLRYTALREFYKERTKLIPLKYSKDNLDTEEKYVNKTIFRGIGINGNIDKFDIEQAFGKTANSKLKLFDFYHTIGYPGGWTQWHGKTLEHYISFDDYSARTISGMSGTRGNITSYSTDPKLCIENYAKSSEVGQRGSNNFLFVIQPNRDLYDIFGKVDGAVETECGHEYEVNIPDVEVSDVAFALKIESNKVTDVILMVNFI